MIVRQMTGTIVNCLSQYPAVVLVGPRQCGKTTLAKSLTGRYFDMEQESDRLKLDISWDSIVQGEALVILDEAQCEPSVFARLRGAIDSDRERNGRFLLLGSVSPALMREVSESLAGRLAIVELEPLSLQESPQPQERHWLYGGYPDGGILKPARFPRWQRDYLSMLAQRDLPLWGLPAKPQTTERMMKMLAIAHGCQWNASQLAKSLGLSYHTVNEYLDFLEGAMLVRRLQPYSTNLKKRLVKSPKVYWRDSGLLHALMGVRDADGLLSQPWVGNSWEGYVIQNIIAFFNARDQPITPYYLRTSDGYEIDLLFEHGADLWGIEIKLSSAPKAADLKRLQHIGGMAGCTRYALICFGGDTIQYEGIFAGTLSQWFDMIDRQ